ncbi:MAG: PAC2 family protein [Nanoarchaeota archaeon]|nr:PAC2 family protein [Nanoarchaeota archaeon]
MNEDFIIKRHGKKPKFKKPILIEGFPGVGNVARIVVDFMISKLKAKKFMELYTYYFPNSVFMNEDHSIEMPKVEFYYHKNLIFVVGDAQPSDEYASYIFSEKLIEIAKSLGVKEIITLGGITSRVYSQNPIVYGAYTDETYVKKLSKIGVHFDRGSPIVIIGAAGLLLGLGKLKGIKGFSLLAETPVQTKFGFAAAKSILEILMKYLNLKFSIKEIEQEVKNIRKLPLIKKKVVKKPQTKHLTYIG